MTAAPYLIHYITIAGAVACNALGVGLGQGITSVAALKAINTQPSARPDIVRAAILGMALIETAAIMGVIFAIILLLDSKSIDANIYGTYAEIGIAFAICLPGLVLGLVSSMPASAACQAIARQPFFGQKIVRFMLITLSLLQTPIIFGFIVGMAIHWQSATITTLRDSLRLIAAGLSIGLGSIGPAIGLAIFAQSACKSLGINRDAYNKILPFTFISETIIETPIIFSLVISLMLLFMVGATETENFVEGMALFSAGLCTGLGTFGPGISSGRTAAAACHQIAHNPDQHTSLSRTSMFAQGLIETCAMYSLLISFLLIFFR